MRKSQVAIIFAVCILVTLGLLGLFKYESNLKAERRSNPDRLICIKLSTYLELTNRVKDLEKRLRQEIVEEKQ